MKMQHFAAVRAEMLTWIEQQMAVRHGPDSRVEGAAAKPARPCVPPPPSPPEQAARALGPAGQAGDELAASEQLSLQPLWDDRTHTVTSVEELADPELAPGAASAVLRSFR